MPAILPRPAKRSFYPDWSTLVYAFDGLDLNAPTEKRDLLRLIHEVAETANLCLSFVHVLELLRGTKRDERLARARWLDTLQVVWLLDQDEVLAWELDRFLRKAAGVFVEPTTIPSSPSLLHALLRYGEPADVPAMILDGTLSRVVEHVGASEQIRASLERFADLGPHYNRLIFSDRKLAERDNLSDDELRAWLKAKLDRLLLDQALDRNRQLVADDQNYRILKNGFWVAPDEDFVRSAMSLLDESRDAFPAAFVFHEVIMNTGFRIARREHVGTKWFKSQDREGDVFDWAHLIGAAYCDLFTCDRYTSECLAGIRGRLGRPKEITYRNDLSSFVQQLREAL